MKSRDEKPAGWQFLPSGDLEPDHQVSYDDHDGSGEETITNKHNNDIEPVFKPFAPSPSPSSSYRLSNLPPTALKPFASSLVDP